MFKILCIFFAFVAIGSCTILREERCDNHDLQLTCFDSKIDIIKVSYGRWKSKQCAPSSVVNCYSTIAQDVVKSLCQNRESCVITVKPQILGDNCPQVSKALEVHYQCVSTPVYPPAPPPQQQQPQYPPQQQPQYQPHQEHQYQPQQNPQHQQNVQPARYQNNQPSQGYQHQG